MYVYTFANENLYALLCCVFWWKKRPFPTQPVSNPFEMTVFIFHITKRIKSKIIVCVMYNNIVSKSPFLWDRKIKFWYIMTFQSVRYLFCIFCIPSYTHHNRILQIPGTAFLFKKKNCIGFELCVFRNVFIDENDRSAVKKRNRRNVALEYS